MIEAKAVRDSISDHDARLLTMKLRLPKFILAEFNTHRMFSRNASSSRAIPTKKLLEEVRSNALRVRPVSWGANQPGMQANEELQGDARKLAEEVWNHAAVDAAYHAERLLKRGVHKQIVNRVIEPFLYVNVVVTATEWGNFFGLRLDKAAQPEMRALAEAMWVVFNESAPLRLGHGQWHLPFVEEEDLDELRLNDSYHCELVEHGVFPAIDTDGVSDAAIKVSVARCARVSYESHETGKRSTIEADVKLHDHLLASRHLSPFEHQATPDEKVFISGGHGSVRSTDNKFIGLASPSNEGSWANWREHGNFTGWRQRRKMISGEAIAPMPMEHRA